jgi:hypothetical protein
MNDLEQLDQPNGIAGFKRASEETEAEGAPDLPRQSKGVPEGQKSAHESTRDAVAMKRSFSKHPNNADGAWQENAAKRTRNATGVPSSANNVSQDVMHLAIKGEDGNVVQLTIAKKRV